MVIGYILFFTSRLPIEEALTAYNLWIIFTFLICGFITLVILYSMYI